MFAHIIDAFFLVTKPISLLMLFTGTFVGAVMGALPGMTATMTIAVLVSFTFGMEPLPGLMLLLGVYGSALYADSVPSILIRTPGTPSAIAAVFDGYPMNVERGQAGKALGIAATASAVGGGVGILIALFLSPVVASFAIGFGSPEIFALALFGLTMVVQISSSEGELIRGLVMAILGLFVSTIGQDPQLGFPRFTFGSISLLSGIKFIPAMIGLFGFSQGLVMLDEIMEQKHIKQKITEVVPNWKDLKEIGPIMSIFAPIGTFIGALPGAGGDIAAFITYDTVKRFFSGRVEIPFGEGNKKGVAAADTGNNSSTAGALIPALTLGIPGDSVTAILIGALMIHGLRPGPLFFNTKPDLAYGIFVGFFLVHVLILFFGLFAARFWAKLVTAPLNVLWPVIFVFCVVGSFALRSSMFDMLTMLVFGVMGFILRQNNYPLMPIVLGIILGPLIETNLRRSLSISGGDPAVFVSSPVTIILLSLALLVLISPIFKKLYSQLAAETE